MVQVCNLALKHDAPLPHESGAFYVYCTLSTAEPVIPPELAPMVLVPVAIQFANPATLGAFAIVAIGAEDELQ